MKKILIGAILGLSYTVNAKVQANLRGVLSNDLAVHSNKDFYPIFQPFEHDHIPNNQVDVIVPQGHHNVTNGTVHHHATNGTVTNSTSNAQTQLQQEIAAQKAAQEAQEQAEIAEQVKMLRDMEYQYPLDPNSISTEPVGWNPNTGSPSNNNDDTNVGGEPHEFHPEPII